MNQLYMDAVVTVEKHVGLEEELLLSVGFQVHVK
jgi:hypothetical protein